MLRIVEEPKAQPIQEPSKAQDMEQDAVLKVTTRQAKKAIRKVVGYIARMIVDHREKVVGLLQDFGVPLTDSPTEREVTQRVIDKLAENDLAFNARLGELIHEHIPGLPKPESYDSFDWASAFGGAAGQAAGGAAAGGIAGGVLGVISGSLDMVNGSREAKLEKEKASALTTSSILNYKTTKEQNKSAARRSKTNVTIAIIAVIGCIGLGLTIYLTTRPKTA